MTTRKPAPSPLVTRACVEGRHQDCGRQVLLAAPDKDGHLYGTCQCPTCKHVPDYRRVR